MKPCAFGEADYESFQQQVQARTGVRLCDYKSDQMRRRLTMLCEQIGCGSFDEYAAALERDPALLPAFLDRMTINVTELLRNPDRFAEPRRPRPPGLARAAKRQPAVSLERWLFLWRGSLYGRHAAC